MKNDKAKMCIQIQYKFITHVSGISWLISSFAASFIFTAGPSREQKSA